MLWREKELLIGPKSSTRGSASSAGVPEVADDLPSGLHAETKKRKSIKKGSRINWDDYDDEAIVQDKELREMLFADPRAETDRTKDLKCKIGVKYVKCGRVFLREGEGLPRLAATAISELVTKKAHMLGVGKEKEGSMLEMDTGDLDMISSLRKKFPGQIKGSFCYEY